jgi:hypothetical protein
MPLEYDRFAFELRSDINTVKSIIKEFDLFENDGSKFWSESVLYRLQKRADKSEKARKSIQSRWEKFKRNTDVLVTNKGRITKKEKKKKDRIEKKGNIPFKVFWDSYDKKIGWIRCETIWSELTNDQRDACMSKIPAYKLSTPDKKFRLNPEKYLSQKGWLNEIIISNEENRSIIREKDKRTNDLWN